MAQIDKYRKNDMFGLKSNNRYEIEIGANDGIINKLLIKSTSKSDDKISLEFGNEMKFRSSLLCEPLLLSFPLATKMFQFTFTSHF